MRKPLAILKTIFALTTEELKNYGKYVVFLDADNTLFLPDVPLAQQDTAKVQAQLMKLKDAGLTLIVISNNFAADKAIFFAGLSIPAIFSAKKPLPFAYRQAHKIAEEILGPTEKSAIVHIGDQFITDAVGSVCYGIDYMLVEPINKNADLIFAKPSRLLEKLLKIYPE